MGTGSKVASVIFRLTELCSAIIVVALLGRFFYLMRLAPSYSTNGRLIYTQVISCLELIASLILVIPFKFTFYAWPLDIIFFICSIVAFGLLASLNTSCSSFWYWNYWGYYWGRFWTVAPRVTITPTVVANTGCGSWRAILAWLFIGAMAWMASALLGSYVFLEIGEEREEDRSRRSSIKEKLTHKHRPVINPETGESPTPKP